MKNAADVIVALQATSGRLDKESIVLQAWNMGITEFFIGAQLAYDALRTFGIKKAPLIEGDDAELVQSSMTFRQFLVIADSLEKRELTGNAARDVLRNAANASTAHEWNNFYRRVLLKDFKAGLTEGTINKVLLKVGKPAEEYLIPEFTCQLAKNGEDHPKKMIGPKFLDQKLDGVRIITIFNVERQTVEQFSRDGRQNDNFGQITGALFNLLPHLTTNMVFDGEMISRNFQSLMRQVNRKDDVDTKDAKLALFDCLPLEDFLAGECMLTQTERHNHLVQFVPLLETYCGGNVFIIPKLFVNLDTEDGKSTFNEFNKDTIDAGYEGVMVKDPSATYKTKRTDGWLKVKPSFTVDLEVVGFEPGTPGTKFANTLGNLVCTGIDNGRLIETAVGSGFSEELREQIWTNRDKVIGRIVEVKTDVITKAQNSDTYSLRFPVFMQFRGWEPGQKI